MSRFNLTKILSGLKEGEYAGLKILKLRNFNIIRNWQQGSRALHHVKAGQEEAFHRGTGGFQTPHF